MLYLLAPGEAMRNYYPMRPATSAYDCGYFLKHESEGDNLNWVEENLKYANELDIPIIAAGALYCIEIYQDKEALGNHLRAQLLDRLTDTTIHGMTPAVQTARKNRRERTNGFVPHTQIIDALTDRAEFLPVPNFIWTPAQ